MFNRFQQRFTQPLLQHTPPLSTIKPISAAVLGSTIIGTGGYKFYQNNYTTRLNSPTSISTITNDTSKSSLDINNLSNPNTHKHDNSNLDIVTTDQTITSMLQNHYNNIDISKYNPHLLFTSITQSPLLSTPITMLASKLIDTPAENNINNHSSTEDEKEKKNNSINDWTNTHPTSTQTSPNTSKQSPHSRPPPSIPQYTNIDTKNDSIASIAKQGVQFYHSNLSSNNTATTTNNNDNHNNNNDNNNNNNNNNTQLTKNDQNMNENTMESKYDIATKNGQNYIRSQLSSHNTHSNLSLEHQQHQQQGPTHSTIHKISSNLNLPPLNRIDSKYLDMGSFLLLSGIGLLGIRFLLYPMNVIKTRLQATTPVPSPLPMLNMVNEQPLNKAMMNKKPPRATQVFLDIVRHEGLKPLFAGLELSLILTVSRQLYFYMYEHLRGFFVTMNDQHKIIQDEALFTPVKDSIAAFVATALYQIISNPLDIIVQRLMTHNRAVKTVEQVAAHQTPVPSSIPSSSTPTTTLQNMSQTNTKVTPGAISGSAEAAAESLASAEAQSLRATAQNITSSNITTKQITSAAISTNKHIADAFDPFAVPEAPNPKTRIMQGLVDKIDAIRLTRNLWFADPAVFYRGFVSSTILWSLNSCIWWGSFELLLQRLTRFFPKSTLEDSQQVHLFDKWLSPEAQSLLHTHPWFAQHFAAGLSSWLSVVLTHPLDTARTRLMVLCRKNDGMTATGAMRKTLQEEGFQGLWRGLGARTVLVVPTSVLTMSVYQLAKVFSVEMRLRHGPKYNTDDNDVTNNNDDNNSNIAHDDNNNKSIYQRAVKKHEATMINGDEIHIRLNSPSSHSSNTISPQRPTFDLSALYQKMVEQHRDNNINNNHGYQQYNHMNQVTQYKGQNHSAKHQTQNHSILNNNSHYQQYQPSSSSEPHRNLNLNNAHNNNYYYNSHHPMHRSSLPSLLPRLPDQFSYTSPDYYQHLSGNNNNKSDHHNNDDTGNFQFGNSGRSNDFKMNTTHNHPYHTHSHAHPTTRPYHAPHPILTTLLAHHEDKTHYDSQQSHQQSQSSQKNVAQSNSQHHQQQQQQQQQSSSSDSPTVLHDNAQHKARMVHHLSPDALSPEEIASLFFQVGEVVGKLEELGYEVRLQLAKSHDEQNENNPNETNNGTDDYCDECNRESRVK